MNTRFVIVGIFYLIQLLPEGFCAKVNETCNNSTFCRTSSLACDAVTSKCLYKADFDVRCTESTQLCVTNAVCANTKSTCKCTSAYTSYGGVCEVTRDTYGGKCTSTTNVTDSCRKNDVNAKCDRTRGVCTCKFGYIGSIGNKCYVIPNTYGGSCTIGKDGTDSCFANDPRSRCSKTSRGICLCKLFYYGSIGEMCSGVVQLAGSLLITFTALLSKNYLL